MSYDYRGKVIAVTGGAGGIAGAFVPHAARRGARLAIIDLRGPAAERVAASLPGSGHRSYAVDLTDEAQVVALVEELDRDFGRLDVLINNAGMSSQERFDERDVASIRRELDVNLLSPLMLTRLAMPLLRAAPDPRVISTVSLGGIFPLGETPIYTASKFGLRGRCSRSGSTSRRRASPSRRCCRRPPTPRCCAGRPSRAATRCSSRTRPSRPPPSRRP
ncbi:SDR family NAD(P)-dependent oxidoreductase [Tessaracoccus coleopterorum]|uniref:SDR family NAD(P)-dependent oxidoreductase n=1 Tax=Tessaracoccus coleopterorum TaxID=2714950 RepID=UPI0018D324D1|nr:SDR family oxidoreductase [Tessaracoccus coleopterorum]